MKKILKTFTFWFVLFAILAIISKQIGGDSKGIGFYGLDPIMGYFASSPSISTILDSGIKVEFVDHMTTYPDKISIYWYIAKIVVGFVYGGIFDFIRIVIKKRINYKPVE